METKQLAPVATCPGCGGVLHQYADDRVISYQCRVGHRFTAESMMVEQNTIVEEHYWRLLAFLKGKEDAARTMAADSASSCNQPLNRNILKNRPPPQPRPITGSTRSSMNSAHAFPWLSEQRCCRCPVRFPGKVKGVAAPLFLVHAVLEFRPMDIWNIFLWGGPPLCPSL
jgi:hypothetical protein